MLQIVFLGSLESSPPNRDASDRVLGGLWKALPPPNRDASDCVLGVFGKLSTRRRGVHGAWFHGVCWTCGAKVS